MKFKISRTSSFDEVMPCEDCIKEQVIRIDERKVDDHKKLQYGSETWFKLGQNHRIVNGKIRRDFREDSWMIEFNTIEELVDFSEKHGPIIIHNNGENNHSIEIYDDYRE